MLLRSQSLLVVLCLICAEAFAASVTWIDGVSPPVAWTVDPNHPGTSDTVLFSGPLNFIYSSSCTASGSLGGTPQITVDTVNQEVTLSFVGPPPESCAAIWAPVSGLQGDFGPLPAGHWTFASASPAIPFNIPFVVGTPASTYYVDQDAPGPVHNGANWYWAFSTLQDALSVAIPGDTILVAEGLYRPDQGPGVTPGDRGASFTLQSGMSLLGGYAGFGEPSPDAQDPGTYRTELSGDLAGNDLYGLLNTEENSYHVVTAQGPAAAGTSIAGVEITNGRAHGSPPHHMGGGLLVDGARVLMSNSLLYGNKGAFGGAVAVNQGRITLINSQVSGNSAELYGGGFYALQGAVTLTNCLVTGNAVNQTGVSVGSVLYGLNSRTYVYSSTLSDNIPNDGQVITSLGWTLPPTHELIVTNSILYNSGLEIVTNHPTTTSVSASDIKGGWSGIGTNNIDENPLFVSPGDWSVEGEWMAGDYHLQNSSPCIDQGRAALLPADVTDLDLNGNTAESLPLDLDHLARTQGSETDMGIYETEIVVTPPPTEPEWIVADEFNITHTPTGPWTNVRLSAAITTNVRLNFKAELSLVINPTSPAGGDWTAVFNPVPGFIGPGTYTVPLEIVGEHVDLSQVASGVQVNLAKLLILARPAQP